MKQYDYIIIGTGAAGSTLANSLSQTGKQILILERGDFLPREKQNWDTKTVFNSDRYHNQEVWFDRTGKEIHPGMSYSVGGNTKLYGAALFRLREKDFETVEHKDGVSPAWGLKYADFAPYYDRAESLYQVHGNQGIDPTEPKRSADFPYPAVSHEPRIAEVKQLLEQQGLHPYPTPLGIQLNESEKLLSACIRCNTCDGFPCLVRAKSDGEVIGILPILSRSNVKLITNAKVEKLHTDSTGTKVTSVVATIDGESQVFQGNTVILCCGAINSAVLLLRSADKHHPQGLANSSGLVGRNFMKHVLGSVIAVSKKPNPTVFQKTLSINDFYWGDSDYPYPMGQIQTLGKVNTDMLAGNPDQYAPLTPEQVATHSIDWWLTTEDLPDPENRILWQNDRIVLQYQENNSESYDRLEKRWIEILQSIDCAESIHSHCSYFVKGSRMVFTGKLPLEGVGHQVGTCRFGEDPLTSVLDLNCRSHDVENLYVVDGSFFPSSGAVNPTLTIIANALRVADHLTQRSRNHE